MVSIFSMIIVVTIIDFFYTSTYCPHAGDRSKVNSSSYEYIADKFPAVAYNAVHDVTIFGTANDNGEIETNTHNTIQIEPNEAYGVTAKGLTTRNCAEESAAYEYPIVYPGDDAIQVNRNEAYGTAIVTERNQACASNHANEADKSVSASGTVDESYVYESINSDYI